METCLNSLQDDVLRQLIPLRKQRNTLLPIHTLPEELQIEILARSLRREKHPTKRLARLETVCDHWWRVIKQAPRLWAYIQYPCTSWVYALSHSRNAPIDLVIKERDTRRNLQLEGFDSFFDTVSKQTDRWKSVRVTLLDLQAVLPTLEEPFPILESLDLNNRGVESSELRLKAAPQLRRVRIRQVSLVWDHAVVSGLESLSLSAMNVPGESWGVQLRAVLESSPRLDRLRLCAITGNSYLPPDASIHTTAYPLVLPLLHALTIRGVDARVLRSLLRIQASEVMHILYLQSSLRSLGEDVLASLVGDGENNGLLRHVLKTRNISQLGISVRVSRSTATLHIEDSDRQHIRVEFEVGNWRMALSQIATRVLNEFTLEVDLGVSGSVDRVGGPPNIREIQYLGDINGLKTLGIQDKAFTRPILQWLTQSPRNCPALTSVVLGLDATRDLSSEIRGLLLDLAQLRPNIIASDINRSLLSAETLAEIA